MKKLVLLRHGESQWNLENRFTGWTNVDLTQKGEEEAKKAGKLLNQEAIEFDVVHESIKLTNISEKFSSIPFNLERSLKIGDEVGGHFVSGHVHNIAEIISFENKKERILKIKIPSNLKGYIFKKGYVSINGISLTVVNVTNNFFTISIIPETISKTNLSFLKKGDFVNVEADQQTISIVETVKKLT